MPSPHLVTAWKRQNVPIVVACSITPLVITPPVTWKRETVPIVAACGITPLVIPPCGTGGMQGVQSISHRTAITPP